mmetsp:Transcript_23109/g.74319  ORF Transcript_23109/g.74319 Transcript_23109/m.74319 type:complete len:203 (+) Transcript_23109:947-1555(+)
MERNPTALHVPSHALCHIPVKSAQRNRAHGHSTRVAQLVEEPRTLESDVGGSDKQRPSGGPLHREEIVARDTELSTGCVRQGRPPPHGNHHRLCCQAANVAVVTGTLDRVWGHKAASGVEVVHLFAPKRRDVAVVGALDVVLHVAHEVHPAVLHCIDGRQLPPELARVVHHGAELARIVHELLRNAPDVDASATEAPARSVR